MMKSKQRQVVPISSNKNGVNGHQVELQGEDTWVMVKKQQVTILIPPLPITKQHTMHEQGESEPCLRPRKASDAQAHCPIMTPPRMQSVFEREKSLSSTPDKVIPTVKKVLPSSHPKSTFLNLSGGEGHRRGMENSQFGTVRRHRKTLRACRISKNCTRHRSFLNGDVLLNPRMRVLHLERKLERAGGLSRWLISLGLDRFVTIFQRRSVTKFQLVNLTMKKLKDMGADAVGPRRKLMHAIDCLCQPYCFEASSMV